MSGKGRGGISAGSNFKVAWSLSRQGRSVTDEKEKKGVKGP